MGFKQPDQTDNPLTPEEDRIHAEALARLQSEIAGGRPFELACEVLTGLPADLRELIRDDFLKILIAEEHFGKDQGLGDLALALGVSYERLSAAREAMLEEVGEEMARQYRKEIAKNAN